MISERLIRFCIAIIKSDYWQESGMCCQCISESNSDSHRAQAVEVLLDLHNVCTLNGGENGLVGHLRSSRVQRKGWRVISGAVARRYLESA